jgi:hypothetical protein
VISTDRDLTTIQDFIVGRLSDNEREVFEDRLVRDPALVRELEQSLRMRGGLQQLRTRGYFRTAAPRRARFGAWMPALVAAACAGIGVSLWLSHAVGPSPILTASLASRGTGDAPPLVAAHFTFVSARSSSVPDLKLPPAGVIEIRTAPASLPVAPRYRVSLVRKQEGIAEELVAAISGLSVNADGYVHCYADAARLGPGSYVLRIQPDANTASTPEIFPFTLRPQATGSSQ